MTSCLAVHQRVCFPTAGVPSQHRLFSAAPVYSPTALKLTRAQANEQLAERVERLSEITDEVAAQELTVLNLKKKALSVCVCCSVFFHSPPLPPPPTTTENFLPPL